MSSHDLMEFPSHLVAITGLLVLVFLYLWRVRFQKHKMNVLMSPEPYGALPIIGHLHQLGGQNPLCQTLSTMADNYGPVFTIWLCKNRALVISNYEAVKECFTTNDRVFATRPTSALGRYLGYNYAAFGLSPYGKYWRDMKKLVMMELLSSRRLETLKHVHISEVEALIKGLYLVWKNKGHDAPCKVVISEWIEHLTLNAMTKIIASGQHFEFIPFGAGRRICPGITFAFQVMHLTVARLIQGFELATPLDKAVACGYD